MTSSLHQMRGCHVKLDYSRAIIKHSLLSPYIVFYCEKIKFVIEYHWYFYFHTTYVVLVICQWYINEQLQKSPIVFNIFNWGNYHTLITASWGTLWHAEQTSLWNGIASPLLSIVSSSALVLGGLTFSFTSKMGNTNTFGKVVVEKSGFFSIFRNSETNKNLIY